MASQAFDDSNWSNYFELTDDNTLKDNANGNVVYSTRKHGAPPAGFWSTVASDGADVRIVNSAGDTAYSLWIEEIDTTNENFTVRWDSSADISTGSNNTWRVYYGNASATAPAEGDTLGKHNVLEAGYKLYWGMNGSTTVFDVTSNSNDGTISGTGEVAGQIGLAQDHEESNNDYVAASDSASLDLGSGNITLGAWVKLESTGSFGGILSKEDGSDNSGYRISKRSSDIVEVYFASASSFDDARSTSSLSAGTWTWVVGRRDGTNVEIFFNGSSEASNTDNGYNTDNNVDIATGPYRASDKTSNMFDGVVDDTWVYSGALSNNYLTTRYNNESNASYWTVGAEQSVGGGDTPGSVRETTSGVNLTTSGVIKTD